MIPQMPQFIWDEIQSSCGAIREELDGETSNYLRGMIQAYESVRIPVALKGLLVNLNPMSGIVPRDSTRLEIARRLLVERALGKTPSVELETIAEDQGFWGEVWWDIKNAFSYDVNHERYYVAKELLKG